MYRGKSQLFMVFDVESVGLYGEGFAVGFVVMDGTGKTLAEDVFCCPPHTAIGLAKDRQWVRENIPKLNCDCSNPVEVREKFAVEWRAWRAKGAVLCADCPYPVEAAFLLTCDLQEEGPYPLIDVGSVRLAVGLDPLGTEERHLNELPHHNPLCDARQSARLLFEALNISGI